LKKASVEALPLTAVSTEKEPSRIKHCHSAPAPESTHTLINLMQNEPNAGSRARASDLQNRLEIALILGTQFPKHTDA
jgi:hypothetical protein